MSDIQATLQSTGVKTPELELPRALPGSGWSEYAPVPGAGGRNFRLGTTFTGVAQEEFANGIAQLKSALESVLSQSLRKGIRESVLGNLTVSGSYINSISPIATSAMDRANRLLREIYGGLFPLGWPRPEFSEGGSSGICITWDDGQNSLDVEVNREPELDLYHTQCGVKSEFRHEPASAQSVQRLLDWLF